MDELYGAADALSMRHAALHRRILFALSLAGTLLTLLFLLYDETELYALILACGLMAGSLFLIRFLANRLQCHRNYLEYRVLAEALRVQYFLYRAGLGESAASLTPWPIRQEIPWVWELLSALPTPEPRPPEQILDCWIREQCAYHRRKLVQLRKKNRRNVWAAKSTLIVTAVSYLAALGLELFWVRQPGGAAGTELLRAVLKIVLGTMSALTLFTGSYYGKMSLPDLIDDYRRMIALYETAEEEILAQGERPALLVRLARECLNETSAWYAYQRKNQPELVI